MVIERALCKARHASFLLPIVEDKPGLYAEICRFDDLFCSVPFCSIPQAIKKIISKQTKSHNGYGTFTFHITIAIVRFKSHTKIQTSVAEKAHSVTTSASTRSLGQTSSLRILVIAVQSIRSSLSSAPTVRCNRVLGIYLELHRHR